MTNKETRLAVVAKGLSRKGKNSYTQGSKRTYVGGYPTVGGKGFSDCSSFVRWCYLKVCGVDIGYNTAAQIVSKKLMDVCPANSKGQPADVSLMLPGDLLYYKGSDKSRPFGVGHVEMYIGDKQLEGHGSGTGPKVHGMTAYNTYRKSIGRGLIKVMRYIPRDASDNAKSLTVTASSLNVRASASLLGKVIVVVKKGATLTPTGAKSGTWVGVTYNGGAAWVSSKYVKEC